MIKIEIKNKFTGSVIFEYSKENNTIKETLLKAIQECADLRDANLIDANLRDANLRDANLIGADLRDANLIDANLRDANLRDANLIDANLRDANLRDADLRDANLIGADLRDANLIGANLIDANLRDANLIGADLRDANLSHADLIGANLPIFCKWAYSTVNNEIKIGCKKNTIEGWESFFKSNATYETKRDTQEFKQIQAVFEACKAYLNFLNK